MPIREVILERIPAQDEVLTIAKSGLFFGAVFIRTNNLTEMKSVSFLVKDEDAYWLGFKFHKDIGRPNSLVLLTRPDSISRTVKAGELFGSNKTLRKIQASKRKIDRTFEIKKDDRNGIFYVDLKPVFEHQYSFENRNAIPAELKGVYRHRGADGRVLYIGKGSIRERANSSDRKDWGIQAIEYSALESSEKCEKWESYYLQRHKEEFGALPPYNVIHGKATTD